MDTIISGIIIDVKKPVFMSDNDQVTFTVAWMEKEENVILTCMFYCPVRKNDCIYAHCLEDKDEKKEIKNEKIKNEKKENKKENKKYIVSRPPMVLINKDKENIILTIMTILKIKYTEYVQALQFYNQIVNEAVEESKVYDYITCLAEKWHNYHDKDVLTMMGDNDYNIDQFLDYWYSEYNLRELKLLGVNANNVKEYDTPCHIFFDQCIENPYPIYTLTIEQCDGILHRMDKLSNKEDREKGIIVRQLYNNAILKQWFCCPTSNIGKQYPMIRKYLEDLKLNYNIVVDMQSVYIKKYYNIETRVTDFIIKMVNEDPVTINDPIDKFYIGKNGSEFIRYKAIDNDKLSKDQQIAVQSALDHKLLLILGGAGVGKTTVIGEIVKNLEMRKLKYLLTGFTGKSVSRLQEVTKMKAFTMHRLIHEALKIKNTEHFDYVIIDEISMVTTELFYQFINVFKNVNQYLFVGDNNQLQPIEAGSLLNELLKASVVPTYYLTKNHRVIDNGERDGILLNANMIINHDISYPFEFEETDNFQIIIGGMDKVFEIIQGCYDAGVSINDIMIISPYKDYVNALNKGCKAIYNKNNQSIHDSRGTIWTVDDKVMLLKNIGQTLYNGQQGIVTLVGPSSITVDFGENGIHMFKLNPKYKNKKDEHDNELTVFKLQHSYANTLHKSQGQEASVVIGFFPDVKESGFLNRPLLYTLITRAKEMDYLVTPSMTLLTNAACRKPSFRYENMAERLKLKLPKITPFKLVEEKKITTKQLYETDPDLEGMEEEEYYDD